jgi:hypothetical protein
MKVGDLVKHKNPWRKPMVGVIVRATVGRRTVQWVDGTKSSYPRYHLWEVTDESR